MFARSWIALLLLANYLLVVGLGCVSRPEDQHELISVQTHVEGHTFQQCRYLRMDGLEAFLEEALTSQYQNDTDPSPHHLISVVNGIDAHCLQLVNWSTATCVIAVGRELLANYQLPVPLDVDQNVDTPPW